jgi:hypothetical protein
MTNTPAYFNAVKIQLLFAVRLPSCPDNAFVCIADATNKTERLFVSKHGVMTFSITTFIIPTFSIMTFSIMTLTTTALAAECSSF